MWKHWLGCRDSKEEMIPILKQRSSEFTQGLADNLITCEELWKLMHGSDEYIILVDTRSSVEMNVSRIKGAISYVTFVSPCFP